MPHATKGDIAGTAHHEAGHAVAAVLLRRPLVRASILPGERNLGHCLMAKPPTRAPLDVDPEDLWSEVALRNEERQLREMERIEDPSWHMREIMVLLAGPIAEIHYRRRGGWRSVGGSQDVGEASDRALKCVSSEPELSAYLRWLWERAKNLITQPTNWGRVDAVARALLQRKTMSGRQIRSAMSEAFEQQMAAKRKGKAEGNGPAKVGLQQGEDHNG